MSMGAAAAEKCDDFGWQPEGAIDPSLVADTFQHPRFGIGRAWSKFAGYSLSADPSLTYLVYTVEGAFDFEVDGQSQQADAESLILFDGEAPTTARTLTNTARFVWYFEPTFLREGRSPFRFHEPIRMSNSPLRALLAMTNTVVNAGAPRTEAARRHLGLSLEHMISGALAEAMSGTEWMSDSRHRDGLFMAAQLAVEEYFRDPSFTVVRLAKELSVSVRTLHETFQRFGTTPRREIERRRLVEVDRITDSRAPASQAIAERAGFSSVAKMRRAATRGHTT